MAQDAIRGYLESLRKDRQPIPQDLTPRSEEVILKHEHRADLRVTLPWHTRDIKRGTLVSIIEQAGLIVEEFLKVL
jgi:hypothetical protein